MSVMQYICFVWSFSTLIQEKEFLKNSGVKESNIAITQYSNTWRRSTGNSVCRLS